MAQLVIRGQIVQWNQPGLPVEPFRVGIGLGTAEYRPFKINPVNNRLRQQVVTMLSGSGSVLASSLNDLKQRTSSSGATEYSSYIFRDGSISIPSEVTRGMRLLERRPKEISMGLSTRTRCREPLLRRLQPTTI